MKVGNYGARLHVRKIYSVIYTQLHINLLIFQLAVENSSYVINISLDTFPAVIHCTDGAMVLTFFYTFYLFFSCLQLISSERQTTPVFNQPRLLEARAHLNTLQALYIEIETSAVEIFNVFSK